ncbi:MAG: hypothetical protein ACYTFW_20845 [Planctomycetota bacterium]|jgi:hypothetical protein
MPMKLMTKAIEKRFAEVGRQEITRAAQEHGTRLSTIQRTEYSLAM